MVIKHASLEKLFNKLKKGQSNAEMLLAHLTMGEKLEDKTQNMLESTKDSRTAGHKLFS